MKNIKTTEDIDVVFLESLELYIFLITLQLDCLNIILRFETTFFSYVNLNNLTISIIRENLL